MVALFKIENLNEKYSDLDGILNEGASTSAELNEALRELLAGLSGQGSPNQGELAPKLARVLHGCNRCSQTELQRYETGPESYDQIFKVFSSRFDALNSRIQMLEQQLSELKNCRSLDLCIIKKSGMMIDKSTMVGQPFSLSDDQQLKFINFSDILSLDTKDCFSPRQERISPSPSIHLKVKQELDRIYDISIRNFTKGKLSDILPKYSPSFSEIGNLESNLIARKEDSPQEADRRRSYSDLAMVPNRSSPIGKTRKKHDDRENVVKPDHFLFDRKQDSKASQLNLFRLFQQKEEVVILKRQQLNLSSAKSSLDEACCELRAGGSNQSSSSDLHSQSQQDVKIDQNIDLDFNLVENYDLENEFNSEESWSRTDRSAVCGDTRINDTLKMNIVDYKTVSHNPISDTTNSVDYGRHSFPRQALTQRDQQVYCQKTWGLSMKMKQTDYSPGFKNSNNHPDDLRASSSSYFDVNEKRKYSHEYEYPQQRTCSQQMISPSRQNTMGTARTLENWMGAAFTESPATAPQQNQAWYERRAGVQVDTQRFKHMIEQLSPEKPSNGEFPNLDMSRPRANTSPQAFTFSPKKPLNRRSHEYASGNRDMVIQEEEFSNADVTDDVWQPKQQEVEPENEIPEIREPSHQFFEQATEVAPKKMSQNQLYNVSKSPLIQPSFRMKGRMDELKDLNHSMPLNFGQLKNPGFGQVQFESLATNCQMPYGIGVQQPFINPRFRLSDFAQAQMMPMNLDHIGISMLPPSRVRVESVESETQTTPQKMSFGMPAQQDEDLNQNKFFHSVEKEYIMETLQSPRAFDHRPISQPERPQSVPMCFNQVAHLIDVSKHQVVPDFKVQRFELTDQTREPEALSSQQWQIRERLLDASANQNLSTQNSVSEREQMLQQVLQSRFMPPLLPHNHNQMSNNTDGQPELAQAQQHLIDNLQRFNTFTPADGSQLLEPASLASSNHNLVPDNEIQPKQPPLARSKTLVKDKECAKDPRMTEQRTQPTEINLLNSNTQLVNFIRITKHQPSRKNMKLKLIFCQNDISDDYKFSKYLEQNRYSRLFNEKELLGEGGFGKVYKVQHVLDQRMYAIKQIQIHLGISEDFKKHSVYREIVAISQVQHKNVVRYHACWIESVPPDMKVVNQAVKKLEQSMKKNLKMRDQTNNKNSESRDSKLTVDRQAPSSTTVNKQSDGKMTEGKNGGNWLAHIHQDSEVRLNEDWNHQKEGPVKTTKFIHSTFSKEMLDIESSEESKAKESSFSSSAISSSSSGSGGSSSCSQEKSFLQESDVISESESEESNSDEETSVDSQGSLYQLIDKEKDFITLNVMIQMEHCIGNTLREFLDSKDYKVNRKMIFHFFKQLINGLKHIHEEGLIHRDIKPANIFIDNARMQLKIGDFGLAKKQNNMKQQLEQEIQGLKRNHVSLANLHQFNSINNIQAKEHLEKKQLKASLIGCKQASADYYAKHAAEYDHMQCNKANESSICAGTPMYQAPEQTMHQIQIAKKTNETVCLTDKVDMFAAGLLLYELCFNFKTQHQRIQKFHQLRTQRKLPDDIFNSMPEERDIILNLTDPDPKKRSSAHYLQNSRTFQTWSFEAKQ